MTYVANCVVWCTRKLRCLAYVDAHGSQEAACAYKLGSHSTVCKWDDKRKALEKLAKKKVVVPKLCFAAWSLPNAPRHRSHFCRARQRLFTPASSHSFTNWRGSFVCGLSSDVRDAFASLNEWCWQRPTR